MRQLRVGIIGTGGMSRVHGRQLKELNEVVIEAVADPSETQRESFAREFEVEQSRTYTDYQLMLKETELDAVVICSPHMLHYQQAKDAIKSGLHVLLEKPMVCSSAECRELIKLASDHGIILQVSYQRHFHPEFQYIRECVQNGLIGKLTTVNASLYQDWNTLTANTWRQNPSLSGGGMLMDSGSHIIDVLLWITGQQPEEVHATIETTGFPVEINSMTTLRFSDGLLGSLTIIGDAPCWHETYVFGGEKGAIFYDNGELTLRYLDQKPLIPTLPVQTTNQDKRFIEAILGRNDDYVRGEYALKVIELTEKIYASANYKLQI
ncbi:Gfo/Idh/MocA family oxidoreductase [Pullulanibacillus sp. KACC 23026]|uniref:Gfo/Idh/MocA family protein n=1 Tax=Pullulanibacillus sp. KACC 23026 TaxID=3028315 RepID=UPI0023B1D51F|nr:Gfo/Idh/MocA family oxidoreductase [Pullulanibacillus sp. KACC 23026]WEG14685.1 Gfo/Idh/MocA family oxidoreductase [Pullulanibacillus sp. KACC 23026]